MPIFDKYLKQEPKETGGEKKESKTYTTKPVAFGNVKVDNPPIDKPNVDYSRSMEYTEDGKPIFRVSQSLIKQFTDKKGNILQYCPFKIYTCNVIKSHGIIQSLPMLKGQFFESLCLGSTAMGDAVTDLPRKLKGSNDKTMDQIRIEEQAVEFKRLCHQYGIEIIPEKNTQVKYKVEYNTEWDLVAYVTGVIDFTHPVLIKNESVDCVIDLKLTENLENTFGSYGWGNAQYMDHIQFDVYNFISGKPCIYWVFDYSKYKRQNMFMHDPDLEDIELMHARIRQSIIELSFCHDSEWPRAGHYESCKDCPHNPRNAGDCQEANNIKII